MAKRNKGTLGTLHVAQVLSVLATAVLLMTPSLAQVPSNAASGAAVSGTQPPQTRVSAHEGVLVPFVARTNYMSVNGFLRWQNFLSTGRWTPIPPRVPSDFTYGLTFSPDGRTLASRTNEGVELWDVKTRRLLRYLSAPGGWLSSIAFTADGKLLVSAGGAKPLLTDSTLWRQGEIRVWETATGKLRQVLWAHPERVVSAMPAPVGHMLVTSGIEVTLRLWNLRTGQVERVLGKSTNIYSNNYSVAFSPDGLSLATGDKHGGSTVGVAILDTDSGRGRGFGAMDARGPFAFSPDSRILATAGKFSFQTATDMAPQLWDVQIGKLKGQLLGHIMTFEEMSFSPDGRYLIAVGWQSGTQGNVTVGQLAVWDTRTLKLKYVQESHKDLLHAVAVSPDSKLAATGGQRDWVRLWDVETGQLLGTLSNPNDAPS